MRGSRMRWALAGLVAVIAAWALLQTGLAVALLMRGPTLIRARLTPPLTSPPLGNLCTEVNFLQLRIGMTQAEVETIVGPYGDHHTADSWRPNGKHIGMVPITRRVGQMPSADQHPQGVLWKDDRGSMVLDFDQSGRLIYGAYCKAPEKDSNK
jgi:hypothetical protein